MVSAILRGCALQGFQCGSGVPITFGAVGAGGANAAVPALGHAPTAAEAALALHRHHRPLPLSLQEPALLTRAGVWREKTGMFRL